MASIIHNFADRLVNAGASRLTRFLSGSQSGGLGPIDNKVLRATLLVNRVNPKYPKVNFLEYEFGGVIREAKELLNIDQQVARPTSTRASVTLKNPETAIRRLNTPDPSSNVNTLYKTKNALANPGILSPHINLNNSNYSRNDIIIINDNVSPPISIVIQNRPQEITVDPQPSWVSIKSMGRNNPFMLYTGGEDTISFDISWFSNDPSNREDVLTKCKLLESWSKADGYLSAPPVLKLSWGSSGIFDNDLFILFSATYKLSNFQDRCVSRISSNKDNINIGLLPSVATQTLVFKRVTPKNLEHTDIIPLDKLKKLDSKSISGIPTESQKME